jgi:nickel/cobalt exporter
LRRAKGGLCAFGSSPHGCGSHPDGTILSHSKFLSACAPRCPVEAGVTLLLSLLFGLLQGLRHAFEPDHVIALSTMISEQRSARRRIGYAAAWGVGHAGMLMSVGAALMLLRVELPPRLDAAFELAVSLMLIGLGLRAIVHAVSQARTRPRVAGGPSPPSNGWRSIGPLAMGMVHGLAGSGALTALVVARLPSVLSGVTFMLVFGAGATLGMSLLASAAGVPMARVLKTHWGMPALLGMTGSISLALGLAWLAPAAVQLATPS